MHVRGHPALPTDAIPPVPVHLHLSCGRSPILGVLFASYGVPKGKRRRSDSTLPSRLTVAYNRNSIYKTEWGVEAYIYKWQ